MSTNAPKIYDFNLPAGGSQYLPASGAMYKILSCLGNVEIQEDVGASVGPLNVGQGMRERSFGGLIIRDKSGSANKGSIVVAGTDFINDTLLGTVSVNDFKAQRVLAKQVYASNNGTVGSAGLVSFVQLQSFTTMVGGGANTKGVYITGLHIHCNGAGSAQEVNLFSDSVPTGSVGMGSATVGDGTNTVSKIAGVGAGNAAVGLIQIRRALIPNGAALDIRPDSPYLVMPGRAFTVQTVGTNVPLSVSMEWFEA